MCDAISFSWAQRELKQNERERGKNATHGKLNFELIIEETVEHFSSGISQAAEENVRAVDSARPALVYKFIYHSLSKDLMIA